MDPSDEALLICFANDRDREESEQAFAKLYKRHAAGIFGFIVNRTGNRNLAEEIGQDIWARFIESSADIARKAQDTTLEFSLKPYLYTMAKNAVIDHYRRIGRAKQLDTEPPDTEGPESQQIENEFMSCIYSKLRLFSHNVTDAFWLTRDGRLSYQQAASEMHLSVETVKGYVKDALKKTRECRELMA